MSSDIMTAVNARWDQLTKPPGSLGRLEQLVTQYAAAKGDAMPDLSRKGMYIFCGDHGVTAEGISAYPAEVTPQMVRNFVRGGAAINALCRHQGIDAVVVDAGVNAPVEDGALDRKIARGTANFCHSPAMSMNQLDQALQSGAELAAEASARYDIVGVGEMGIGNTTAAAALLCAFAGTQPGDAAGRGTGLDDDGVRRKGAVIERALALHRPDPATPRETLAALGGFEIAMMAGLLLEAPKHKLPVVVDGFISGSAALAALSIDPGILPNLFFSHRSAEHGHREMLSHMGAEPILVLGMRLGEGTGAALAIGLIEAAVRVYREMATFAEAAVSEGQPGAGA